MKKSLLIPFIVFLLATLPAFSDPSISRNGNGGGGGNRGSKGSVPARGSGARSVRSSGRSYRSTSPRSNGGGYYRRNYGNYSNRGNYGQNYSNNARSYRSYSRTPSQRVQRMGVASVPHIANHSQVLPGNLRHAPSGVPSRGPNGVALATRAVSPGRMSSSLVRNQMSKIANNPGFSRQVNTYNATESQVGHYYWHNLNGGSFCHYCDRFGGNWYGWCSGAGFFWTQFYWGNWWWQDPLLNNWCYWNNGYWWWQNPQTQIVYVYNNGNYVPAEDSNNAGYNNGPGNENNNYSQAPENPPPQNNQADDSASTSGQTDEKENPYVFKSPDGTLMVEVAKGSGDAFLYQVVGEEDSKPLYLDSNVAYVKYSLKGDKLRILLIKEDGSFEVFSADGSSLDGGKPSGLPGENKPAVGLES
jgi:hypothetical protein